MCLTLGIRETNKLKKAKYGHVRVRFKAVNSVSFKSPIFCHPFYLGHNFSDRLSTELTPNEICNETVEEGFHVFTSAEEAKKRYPRCVILKVLCYSHHFVASNPDRTQEVYTQIFVQPEVVK